MSVEFPVRITPEAASQLRRLWERKGGEGMFFRIGVKGGGCSGMEYLLKLDEKRTAYDIELDVDGMLVVCDAKSAMYLKGSTLVYTGNLIGGGFAFENPNAQRSCGCGTSFVPKE